MHLERVRSRYTGKERDTESGNDYFGARYYASSMGRFLSPDWSAKYEPVPYAKLDNPQTLNLYAYVGNNPLRTTDPDGHDGACAKNDAGCSVTVDKKNQTATLTQTHSTTVLKDASGNVTSDNKQAVSSTTTTTTTSVTVSTAAKSNGQVLGGETTKTTSVVDLQNPGGGVQESKSTTALNPLQAVQAVGGDRMEALQNQVSPGIGDRLMDHKVGVGGTALGTGIAVGCALAEPCGAAVVVTGAVIAGGSAIYDMATH